MPDVPTDELVCLYRSGQTLVEIEAATGVGRRTVERRLLAAGMALRQAGWRPGRRRRDTEDADLAGRYRAGETVNAIAAATGLSRSTIRARLKRSGVELRSAAEARQYARLDLPVGEIIERYRAGESTGAIGRSLGVSAQCIRERLIEAGVERRPKGTHPRPERMPRQRPASANQAGAKRRAVEEFLRHPEAKGMTQQQIAAACNVDHSYVCMIAKRLRVANHGT